MPITRLHPAKELENERIADLKRILPEAFADGKINWETLKSSLGELLEDEGENVEHFGLFWPGKRKARRFAGSPTSSTLIPIQGDGLEDEKTKNIFIEGDNLEVLKLIKKSYASRIKLIYIDPPYNTGGSDFVYSDDYTTPIEQYLKVTGQKTSEGQALTSNPETSGRFHSKWLSMIYPRLMVGRQLLREDGLIVISIDDNEVENLRILCNEIFGEENFVAQISVQSNPRGRQADTFFATVHEYLIVYSKDREYCGITGAALTEEQKAEFDQKDNDGKAYRLLGLRQRGAASLRKDRPEMFFEIYVNPKTLKISFVPDTGFTEKVVPRKSTGEDGRWMWGKDKCKRDINLLVPRLIERRSEYDIFVKDYLEKGGEERSRKFKTIWDSKALNTQNATQEVKELLGCAAVSFPKPVALIKDIFQFGVEEGDLVLDFFAGSGTTGDALFRQNAEDNGNRRFILVQLQELLDPKSNEQSIGAEFCKNIGKPQNLAEVCKERLRRAAKSIKKVWLASNTHQGKKDGQKFGEQDFGFKSYRLAPSNFKLWNDYAGKNAPQLQALFDEHEGALISGWTKKDLLAEITLLEGYPLDSNIDILQGFSRNKIHKVQSEFAITQLFVCLDETVYSETVGQLQINAGDVFICLDKALTDLTKLRLADKCNLKVI